MTVRTSDTPQIWSSLGDASTPRCKHSSRPDRGPCAGCVIDSDPTVPVQRLPAPRRDVDGGGRAVAVRHSARAGFAFSVATTDEPAPRRERGFGAERPGTTSEAAIAEFFDAIDRNEQMPDPPRAVRARKAEPEAADPEEPA